MQRTMAVCAAALALLAACDAKEPDITQAVPATGEVLQDYSKNITETVKIGSDGELVQYFCMNVLAGPCPADIGERLRPFGFADDATGVDLGYAFAMMAADAIDGAADFVSDDQAFLKGAYKAVLGREPDEGGGRSNLAFIQDTGQRRTLVRSMLESTEFQSK
jgi:Domain of unknown function (DUF4214)